MKKLLLMLILFLNFVVYSQEYPKLETDINGCTIVVMTLEQAQKIDNSFELLKLMEKSSIECDSLKISYLKVIDVYKNQVGLLETDITLYKSQIVDKNRQIESLQKIISNCEQGAHVCDEQITVRDEQIDLMKKEIKTLKRKRNIAYGVGLTGIIGGILMVILIH